jgi:acyl-coenzyme A thioesterase 9
MEQGMVSLSKQQPNTAEMKLVHQLYLEYQQYVEPGNHVTKPENVTWMKDSIQQSIQFSFPQDRNMHQNIFGGWLMKQAFELAFATSIMFCRNRPAFLMLEEVIFKKVWIGRFYLCSRFQLAA